MFKKIKTWNDVCKTLGIDAKAIPGVSTLSEADGKLTIAFYMAAKIADAINYKDEKKENYGYAPYFVKKNKGGLSFLGSGSGAAWAYSGAAAAARLCFNTRAGAEHAGKIFIKVYTDLIG